MQFYRVDHPTILSGLVVRYRPLYWTGDISASRDGVQVQGALPSMYPDDLIEFKQVLDRAMRQYESIRNTREALSTDGDPECVVEFHKAVFGADDIVTLRAAAPATRSNGGDE